MRRLPQIWFRDRARADREIASLSKALPRDLADRIDLLLAASPAPEQGLHYLARFPAERVTIKNLRALIAIFTNSNFLAEELIEHPEWISEIHSLDRTLEATDFRAGLSAAIPAGLPEPLALAAFRRRQLLRIVVRDVTGLASLAEITAELSALADTIVEFAYERIFEDMVRRFGDPRAGDHDAHFSVIALGKLGGNELNYSSDIDLMFLYSENGETSGPQRITNKEFFQRAANQLTAILSTY